MSLLNWIISYGLSQRQKDPRKLLVTQKKLFHAASQPLHLRQAISQDQF